MSLRFVEINITMQENREQLFYAFTHSHLIEFSLLLRLCRNSGEFFFDRGRPPVDMLRMVDKGGILSMAPLDQKRKAPRVI